VKDIARRGEGARSSRRAERGSAGRERVGFHDNPLLSVALPAWRSKLLLFMLFVGFVALGGRAFYLMGGISTDFLQRQGEARYARTLEVLATRGRITDRNGIARLVGPRAQLGHSRGCRGHAAANRRMAWLAGAQSGLSDACGRRPHFRLPAAPGRCEIAEKIASLKIAASTESRIQAALPRRSTSAHPVGFTNVEDRGQEGVELSQDKILRDGAGSRR
jgi:cell division protein FtsI (penicillin-binding protein 3)